MSEVPFGWLITRLSRGLIGTPRALNSTTEVGSQLSDHDSVAVGGEKRGGGTTDAATGAGREGGVGKCLCSARHHGTVVFRERLRARRSESEGAVRSAA